MSGERNTLPYEPDRNLHPLPRELALKAYAMLGWCYPCIEDQDPADLDNAVVIEDLDQLDQADTSSDPAEHS